MSQDDPLALRDGVEIEGDFHIHGKDERILCVTEAPGRPKNRKVVLNEIVVGIDGMIPLWREGVTLYWRFHERSFRAFANPAAAKARIRELMATALDRWGDASPVAFQERESGWDFEVILRNADDCRNGGCVLASAFFPDKGQHKLTIYPMMLQQDEEEQIETLIHEIGHMFGLRHFFAKVSESQNPSEIFGTHVKFSIMNYGSDSRLTESDRSDLKELYKRARARELVAINGTPIQLVSPFSSFGT